MPICGRLSCCTCVDIAWSNFSLTQSGWAVKSINAARIALKGKGDHKVSLDEVIQTMMETGKDMKVKYKETSKGGLAVNVVEC